MSFTPGVPKTIIATITDVNRVYGFQATARFEGRPKDQAGAFAPGSGQTILCSRLDLTGQSAKGPMGCPADRPLEYIEHSAPSSSSTFTFEWTPPDNASSNIILYFAGNAANDDRNSTGDRIHTATLTLTPGASGGTRPTIDGTRTQSAGAFGGGKTIAPGSWIEIFGSNLATVTREWAGSDFNGANAPTTLEGVSVRVGGQPAFVRFVSPEQVNVQVPDNIGAGPTGVLLTNSAGSSDPMQMTAAARTPLILAPPQFLVGGKQYAVAQFQDQVFVGRENLIAGVPFRPARPGDRITIFAIGCGATNPAKPAGVVVDAANSLPNAVLRFGSVNATLEYAGLAPQAIGLYQFNVTVPNVPDGDVELTGSIDGTPFQSGLFLTVRGAGQSPTPGAPDNPYPYSRR